MNKEELENYIKTNVPKLIIDNVKCEAVSAYGSINVDELTTAIDRLKKVPNYDDLLKENNKLNKALLDIKEYIEKHKETRVHYEPYGTPMGNHNYITTHIFGYYELLDIVNKTIGDDK